MDKQFLLTILKPAHGLFNLAVAGLFLYQAWKGILIRRARFAGSPIPFPAVKLHRKLGPIAAMMAAAGYVAGLLLVYYDKRAIFVHPMHLAVGTFLVTALVAAVIMSRKIKATTPEIRTLHFRLGIVVLTLYLVEAVLGLGILF